MCVTVLKKMHYLFLEYLLQSEIKEKKELMKKKPNMYQEITTQKKIAHFFLVYLFNK